MFPSKREQLVNSNYIREQRMTKHERLTFLNVQHDQGMTAKGAVLYELRFVLDDILASL